MARMRTWALGAALLVGGAGCGSAVRRVHDGDAFAVAAEEVLLRVRNNTTADAKIFVVVDGGWKLVGFVAGLSSAHFELGDLERTGAPLRILATPLTGEGAVHSDPLGVRPGQTVTFTIEPDFARSSAVVRPTAAPPDRE